MKNLTGSVAGIVLIGVFVIALIFGSIYIEMVLWNDALVPAVNGINPVDYWQMFGISVLCMLLFKSTSYKSK